MDKRWIRGEKAVNKGREGLNANVLEGRHEVTRKCARSGHKVLANAPNRGTCECARRIALHGKVSSD